MALRLRVLPAMLPLMNFAEALAVTAISGAAAWMVTPSGE